MNFGRQYLGMVRRMDKEQKKREMLARIEARCIAVRREEIKLVVNNYKSRGVIWETK